MRNKLRTILISLGTVLILLALFLSLYNINESRKAGKRANDALTALKAAIPEISAVTVEDGETPVSGQELFEMYEPAAAESVAAVEISGVSYCGYLELPSLGIELPVMDEFSYQGLKTAPCRYSGSVDDGSLIIAAHNYDTHFGKIRSLSDGDAVVFVDCSGGRHSYSVLSVEEIGGSDRDSMLSGAGKEWQLTLFTCTLSGQRRVTVRAANTDK